MGETKEVNFTWESVNCKGPFPSETDFGKSFEEAGSLKCMPGENL